MSIFGSNREKESNPNPGYTPPVNTPSPTPSPVSTPVSTMSPSSTNISDGAILDGQIRIEGDIKIDGIIKGSVTSKGKVVMGKSGKVEGDIICQNAEISGYVSGKLKIADILMLKSGAQIDGDINTGKLVIESGVKFNGNCSMGSPAPQAPATPTPPKPVGNSLDQNAK
jgi:cytoskeletal protein CcmA (bactofilin family)